MRALIEIAAAEGPCEALVAQPVGAQRREWPGVLLCIDALGLRPRIEEMADRVASWGYTVLAPNLLYRSGSAAATRATGDLRAPGAMDAFFAEAKPRIKTLTAERIKADLPHYLQALRALPGVAKGPIGVHGYCLGARVAVQAAGLDPTVAACAGFHGGGLATEAPDSPHRTVARARARFLFGHADHDPGMDPAAVARLEAALSAAGRTFTSAIYPDAAHGYSMADSPMFQEAACERHFAELKVLYDATLN